MNRRNASYARTARLLSVASASLAAALTAQPAQAQDADAGVSSEEEIVVTAQKREERLQDVPISIAVLGGELLDRQTTGGTLEALLEVPGVSQSGNDAGNLYQVSIRGVAPSVPFGSGSSTVGYYMDTVPFALVRAAIVPNTSGYDMERIEVLRGPQGTLYGASALNGVVRILTNEADPSQVEIKGRVGVSSTEGSSDLNYRTDFAVNAPIVEDRLALRIVGGHESLGGWINQPARNVEDANSSSSDNIRAKLAFLPTDNLRIDLGFWYSHEENDAGNYADDDGNQSTTVAQPGVVEYRAYSANVAYDLPFMTIESATSYLDLEFLINSDFSYVTGGLVPVNLISEFPTKVFTEELIFNSVGEGPWRMSGGLFYRDAQAEISFVADGLLPGLLTWRDTSESYAAFGQVTRAFADGQFELTAGLRYFHDTSTTEILPGGFLPTAENSADFEAVTPRITATWLPSRSFTAYASYSQGFRSGLIQAPLTLVAAPDLQPADADTLHNYEIGAKGDVLDGAVSFEGALFYIDWQNVQQIGNVLYNNAYLPATVNGSSASGVGAELSVTVRPTTGFQIGGSVSYSGLALDEDVESQGIVLYESGDRLANSPEWSASAFASYGFPISSSLEGRFNVSASYRSETALRITVGNGVNVLPAIYESDEPLNVNANFELSSDSGKTLSVYVQNLTDWDGITTPDAVPTTTFRPRPTTVGVQLELRY